MSRALALLALTLVACGTSSFPPAPARVVSLPECPGSLEIHATGHPCLVGHNEAHEACFWRCR